MSSSPFSPPSCQKARVSIIGAGKVGSTLAQRVAEKNLADVVMLDVLEGMPQGIALDLMEARGVEGHDRQIVGTNDYDETANSDIVVITAGRPRKPGMNRDDLIEINAAIVKTAASEAIARSHFNCGDQSSRCDDLRCLGSLATPLPSGDWDGGSIGCGAL
jgi:malate dehydrogenase